MSYRPENQSIEGPAMEIVEGIAGFQAAVEKRIECGEWASRHIDKLTLVAAELGSMKYRLLQLAEETW
jgi:hypothetical protein